MFDNIIHNYDLFIFDLDDTLIKTEKIHYRAWILTLQKTLKSDFFISEDTYFSIFHCINPNNLNDYLIKLFKRNDCKDIINIKNNIYFDLINEKKNEIEMIYGTVELLEEIIKNKKKFVIVSNSLKEQIDFFLELFPILKNSSKNYYREMFKNKKPNPECYLKVLYDFPNKKMVGFEDSITGIHSITQVPEIFVYFINNNTYIHYEYIIKNYNVNNIKNFAELY